MGSVGCREEYVCLHLERTGQEPVSRHLRDVVVAPMTQEAGIPPSGLHGRSGLRFGWC
jgi:hypothetical protein